jgi:hypothetical protein
MRLRDRVVQYGLSKLFCIFFRSTALVIGVFGAIGSGFAGANAPVCCKNATVFAAAPTSTICWVPSIYALVRLKAPPPYLKTTPLRNIELLMFIPSISTVVPFSKMPPSAIIRGGGGTTGTNRLFSANTEDCRMRDVWCSTRNIQTAPSTNDASVTENLRTCPPSENALLLLVRSGIVVGTFAERWIFHDVGGDKKPTIASSVDMGRVVNVRILDETVNAVLQFGLGMRVLNLVPFVQQYRDSEQRFDRCFRDQERATERRVGVVGIFRTSLVRMAGGEKLTNPSRSLSHILENPDELELYKLPLRVVSSGERRSVMRVGVCARSNPRSIGSDSNTVSSLESGNLFCQLAILFVGAVCRFNQGLMCSPPLEVGYSGIGGNGEEGEPSGPANRILYAIGSVVIGGRISFRLLVLGKNFCEPFLPNLVLLLIAFVCCSYGFGVLLKLTIQYF